MSDSRSTFNFPASPWRRMAAAVYDSLLLIALWVVVTMIAVPICHALGLDSDTPLISALRFLVGAAFFGWSWTHGGATPGMLAWHLQVRRVDASVLNWPIATGRYAVMLATWALSLLPLLLLLPERLLARIPHPFATAWIDIFLLLMMLASCLADGRRRAPCDRFTDTEVVLIAGKNKLG